MDAELIGARCLPRALTQKAPSGAFVVLVGSLAVTGRFQSAVTGCNRPKADISSTASAQDGEAYAVEDAHRRDVYLG